VKGDGRIVRRACTVAGVIVVSVVVDTAFRFWLFFPGFFQFDDWMTVTLRGSVDWQHAHHTHLLFSIWVLKRLYGLFGYHTWYVLVANLVLWHAGLAAVVLAVYRTTRSHHALWLLSLTFWPAVWVYLPLFWKDFTFGLLVWLGAGLCLLATTFDQPTTVGGRVRLAVFWIVVVAVFLAALYWRHNAIATVAPLSLYLAHRLGSAGSRSGFGSVAYVRRAGTAYLAMCLCLVFLVTMHAAIFGKPGQKGMTRHILLHDLIGISALSGRNQIPEAAYLPGVTFAKVREQYARSPTNIDSFIWGRMLDETAPVNLSREWFRAVRRNPVAYLRHKVRFSRSLLLGLPWLPGIRDLEADMRVEWADQDWFNAYVHDMMAVFPRRERSITFTPVRRAICGAALAATRAANPPLIVYLAGSLGGLVGCLVWIRRNALRKPSANHVDLVVLGLCSFLAALATLAAIAAFAPHPSYRYAFPAVLLTIFGWVVVALEWRRS